MRRWRFVPWTGSLAFLVIADGLSQPPIRVVVCKDVAALRLLVERGPVNRLVLE
jgi:hypothetical protein